MASGPPESRGAFDMRTLIKHGILLISLATLVACGGDEKPAQDPSAMNAAPPPPAPIPESKPATNDPKPVENALGGGTNAGNDPQPPAKPAEKPLSDGEILMVTSTANNGEIEMAELAKKNATNGDVKGFAAMMITQHRDMENKGKAVASKAKITPADNETSSALKSDVQSTISSLRTQKGKDFDKAYIESQVKAHRDVLTIFDSKLLPNAQNGELKTLLADDRTHVAQHLSKAEEIQQKLDTGAAAPPAKPSTPAKPPTAPAKPTPKM
jgi:putative membrane protein